MTGFDIIGDIHGCYEELHELILQLGYYRSQSWFHNENRRLIFVGDLFDRGPYNPRVYRLVRQLITDGRAFCVSGNHDNKLLRYLKGNPVKIGHGMEKTLDQFHRAGVNLNEVKEFLETLPYMIETPSLRIVHAAWKSGKRFKYEKELALYGEVKRSNDSSHPVRLYNWVKEYKDSRLLAHGHNWCEKVEIFNTDGGQIYNLDTGCVFGGYLTALRLPEKTIHQVKAKRQYWESKNLS